MTFFDNLSKQLSNTGQNVRSKARIIADVTQCNSAISEKKRQITQLYTEIGQAYYLAHRDDESPEEIERIRQVSTLNQEIAALEEQVRTLKRVVKCPNCGAKISEEAAFCSSCGMKIVPLKTAQEKAGDVCPFCGAMVSEGSLFCTNCGAKMKAPAGEPEDGTEEDVVAERAVRMCPSCGSKLLPDSRFCTNCGAKIE